MTLDDGVRALATRVGAEFKSVRGEVSSSSRDMGTGGTFPATGNRRGDLYSHTTLGLHQYDGVQWMPSNVLNPAIEGSSLIAYGHSFVASDNFGNNSAQRYINRVFSRGRFGSISNRAVSDYRMSDAAMDAIGTRDASKKWTVGTRGVVVIDATANDILFNGTTTRALLGYRNSLRALLNFISLGTITDSASWSTTGSIVTNPIADSYGGSTLRMASGQSGTASTTFSGTSVVVGALGLTGTSGGSFEILVDGAVKGSYSTNAQGVESSASTVSRAWVPVSVPITGLSSGSHTLQVRPTGGGAANGDGPHVDYLGVPSTTPPLIVIVKAVRMTTAGYANSPVGSNDATVSTYNTILEEEAALLPNVVVCDPTPVWNPAIHTGADGVHPGVRGTAHLAACVMNRLQDAPFTAGSTGL